MNIQALHLPQMDFELETPKKLTKNQNSTFLTLIEKEESKKEMTGLLLKSENYSDQAVNLFSENNSLLDFQAPKNNFF